MIALVLGIVLSSGPLTLPEPRRCTTGCTTRLEYDTEVTLCWYELLPACHRFQRECVDQELVICKPQVVNLGPWDFIPDPNDPIYYSPALPAPPPSTLLPMGP